LAVDSWGSLRMTRGSLGWFGVESSSILGLGETERWPSLMSALDRGGSMSIFPPGPAEIRSLCPRGWATGCAIFQEIALRRPVGNCLGAKGLKVGFLFSLADSWGPQGKRRDRVMIPRTWFWLGLPYPRVPPLAAR